MLDPGSAQNRFRACLYNRVDLEKLPADERSFMQSHVPVACDGKPVDLDKWIKATEHNPQKNALVTTQIASVAELKARVDLARQTIRAAHDRLLKSK